MIVIKGLTGTHAENRVFQPKGREDSLFSGEIRFSERKFTFTGSRRKPGGGGGCLALRESSSGLLAG
jgi:hypothetical protein